MKNCINSKEKFLKVMNFQPCDRTLNWEFGYWAETLERWYEEELTKIVGLPKKFNYGDNSIVGPGMPTTCGEEITWGGETTPTPRDYDVFNYFNFDEGFNILPYNYWLFPKFDKKIVCEDERYIELYDADGIRVRNFKGATSMPFWLEWPVKSRKDWELIKEERFNLSTISKRLSFNIEKFKNNKKFNNTPLVLFDVPVGFFGSLRTLIGENRLYMLYYDDPKLIKDILEHLCLLWLSIAEELTSKFDFDVVSFWEDMSGKQGSLISPATFKEFMSPCYKKLTKFLESKKIKLFLVDTDGAVEGLIPLFLEAGINTMYPFEQQAGNDLLAIRNKYPMLRMFGGFDKNTLYKGKLNIDKELEKMVFLIRKGGYIPYADHLIPPNSSWENFKYYRNKLKNIIYSTKVVL